MRDLTGVVEQLRNVREAQRKYLQLWAVEQAVIVPALDRVAADMECVVFGPMCEHLHRRAFVADGSRCVNGNNYVEHRPGQRDQYRANH